MTHGRCLEYLKSLQRFGIKLGLDNIRTLLGSLGDPDRRFPSALIAGTNGKGSVAAMLARILSEHGFRTGLYTSPHLVRVEERIRIGDDLIPVKAFCRALTTVRERADGLLVSGGLDHPPTFFEVLTAAALVHFAEEAVDFAVLEVGMGGRFDATNAVTPLLSVITTISMDHQEYLGRTLREIAFEKAGIIKEGVPLVCGVRGGTALRVIRRRARELRAPVVEVFGPGTAFASRPGKSGFKFAYDTGRTRYEFKPSLPGFHQGENAAVVLRAAEVIGRVWRPLDRRKTVEAVSRTQWEGRLERIGLKPPIILDGAHNPEGAASLAAYLRDVVRKPVILIFDSMKDKDIRAIAAPLFPLARTVILTRVPMARAADPEEVLRHWKGRRDNILTEPDVGKALKLAKRLAGTRTPVLAAGSLFLVGEIKRTLSRGEP
jgi:dihydrofolate synthase/folylpolyglutamate synthase